MFKSHVDVVSKLGKAIIYATWRALWYSSFDDDGKFGDWPQFMNIDYILEAIYAEFLFYYTRNMLYLLKNSGTSMTEKIKKPEDIQA